MNTGRSSWPEALAQQISVMVFPRSPLVIAETLSLYL